jgi:hypothetical protein
VPKPLTNIQTPMAFEAGADTDGHTEQPLPAFYRARR